MVVDKEAYKECCRNGVCKPAVEHNGLFLLHWGGTYNAQLQRAKSHACFAGLSFGHSISLTYLPKNRV